MSNLKNWENKIKAIRYKSNFRDFIKEIASFIPVLLYKDETWVTRYPNTSRIKKKVSIKNYFENIDNNLKTWFSYDYNKTFFQNLSSLFGLVPYPSLIQWWENDSCDYSDSVMNCKNVYLSFIIINNCENVLYTFYVQDNCKDILNSVMVWDNSQIVYYCTAILNSFKIFYSKYIVDSNNVWFSSNLMWCSECIFCDNLQNKKYCIKNKELKKEEYFEEKEKILKNKESFYEFYKNVNRKANNFASKNVSWNFCVKSENVENGYFTYNLKNWKNAFFVWDKDWRENVVDVVCSDDPWSKDIFACSNMWTLINSYICDCVVWQNLYYCFNCINCSYCFWCNWLLNKSYCIFNKEFSKEDWSLEVEKYFQIIEKQWVLWKFFPWEMNPFYFNDSLAYLIDDSFTKKEVEKDWFMWREEKIKIDISKDAEVIDILWLSDYQLFDKNWNWKIDSSILKKVIIDENWDYYKIVKLEYDFLIKYSLPLPNNHWQERIKDWLKN